MNDERRREISKARIVERLREVYADLQPYLEAEEQAIERMPVGPREDGPTSAAGWETYDHLEKALQGISLAADFVHCVQAQSKARYPECDHTNALEVLHELKLNHLKNDM